MDKIMRKVILAIGILLAASVMMKAFLSSLAWAQAPLPGASGPATGTGYPAGAVPLAAAASGADTTSAAITLGPVTGRLTYVCGFAISGLGATAATNVLVTVGNISYSYAFTGTATTINTPISSNFAPCIPATTSGTGITITVPGAAGNTVTNLVAWGYAL
jgi:hypothetical protein